MLAFVALLALTTLTLALSFVELGAAGIPVAVGIAAAKSIVIALYFMHLAEHRTSSWVAFTTGVLLAVLLMAFSALDVVSRDPPPVNAAASAAEAR